MNERDQHRKRRVSEPDPEEQGLALQTAAKWMLGAAMLSLATSVVFGWTTPGKTVAGWSLPVSGGTVGPFQVERSNTVFEVEVQHYTSAQSYAFVGGSVLDDAKQPVLGFGDEMWQESGYDDEGAWSEQDSEYSLKFTVPDPGTYYLNFELEEGTSSSQAPIKIRLHQLLGSSLPHVWLGVLCLLAAVGTWFYGKLKLEEEA